MTSEKYEFIKLDNFTTNLDKYFRRDKKRILEKLKQLLETTPNRHAMLKGVVTVAGLKLHGLRHVKVGVKGYKGGAAAKYRICEECLENKYYERSRVKCEFCDEEKPYRVVLFDILPRGFGYR